MEMTKVLSRLIFVSLKVKFYCLIILSLIYFLISNYNCIYCSVSLLSCLYAFQMTIRCHHLCKLPLGGWRQQLYCPLSFLSQGGADLIPSAFHKRCFTLQLPSKPPLDTLQSHNTGLSKGKPWGTITSSTLLLHFFLTYPVQSQPLSL